MFAIVFLLVSAVSSRCTLGQQPSVFPTKSWEVRSPAELGLSKSKLDDLARLLGGRGCVIRDGYLAKTWGDQSQVSDWFSSAKPVLSTLLFFAIEEGLVKGVDQPITDFGWPLSEKDRTMTFRHLGAMTSGYARPERPGEAWSYNDFAIQLYQKTLFDQVYKADAKLVAEHPSRLGVLGFEDGLKFNGKRRVYASVRDFSRIVWFWMNQGKWRERQVLPRKYFELYMKPQTARDLPLTAEADTNDYLAIGSYGGGSDHFTTAGAGVYGFNWWFNNLGRSHPDELTWPAAPADTVMSIGARGNNAAFIPSLGVALICADGSWNDLKAGNASSRINLALKLLTEAATDDPKEGTNSND